ncbi:aspartyl protease family protein [Algoriphagus sp. D3-2-R+10]|uniref:aspartyl protease family protein n=1 Tax=Algoriphagus aurantiacus TaxID=3103948 RepID=UPI002B379C1F|nr:aspartyl protease family protein [Algoriphagus sp. D3-2-R+10]MEB2775420.1 aspartyl protease family protein [Algoriphagus sp. D3-2-R+10]
MIKRLFVATILLAVGAFFYSKYVKNVTEVIPFEVVRNAIFLSVEINGEVFTFQFDTGAPTTISPDAAKRLGLDSIGWHHGMDYYGNTDSVTNTIIPEISIGKIKVRNLKTSIIAPGDMYEICNIHLDGYLGLEFFDKKVIEIDLKSKQLTIANSVNALSNNYSDFVEIKYPDEQITPLIPIYHVGTNAAELVQFDTGSGNRFFNMSKKTFEKMVDDNVLSPDLITDTLYSFTARGLFGTQQDTLNYSFEAEGLRVGETIFSNVPVYTFETGWVSNLGAGLLEKAVVVIDLVKDRFYVKPHENANLDFKRKLDFQTINHQVSFIKPNSAAYLAGIREGDILKSINNLHLDSITFCDQLNMDWSEIYLQKNIRFVFSSEEGEVVYNYVASEPTTVE